MTEQQGQGEIKRQPVLWSSSFLQICGVNLLLFVGFHMLSATFPFFIRDLGGDEAIAGLAAGIFSIASVISRPVVGWALDNKNRRNILLFGMVLMVVAPLTYSVFRIIALVICLRMIHGVIWAIASTATNTIVCDILPRQRFGEGMGYFGMTAAISTAVAPVIGLSLMHAYGFNVLFIASTILALIALLSGFSVRPAPLPADRPRTDLLHGLKTLLEKDALPATVIIFFFLMPYGAVNTFVAMYAEQSGMALVNSGIYFTFLALTTALMRVLAGRVADHKGEGPMVAISCACQVVALVLLAFFHNQVTYIISALFFGTGFGLMTPSMQAMAMRIASPERRGAASSTYLCGFDIGIGMGGIFAGMLVKNFGYSNMFALMILSLFASLCVYLLWGRRHPSSFNYAQRRQS